MSRFDTKWHLTAAFVFSLWVVPSLAQTPQVDPNQLRPFIKDFEAQLVLQINAVLPGPLALTSKPIGFFKDGSGYTFVFAANIGRGVINSPFGTYTNPTAPNAEQRKKVIENIKDRLIQVLFDKGPAMPRLQKDMSVTISAQLDYFSPFEDGFERMIIITAKKSDIDAGLRTKVAISEY